MYLMLSVAGHLTIFLTRTRGPFWSIRPARILCIGRPRTQALATLIAVYGLFMTPLGWGWAAFVWGYAIIWAPVSDRAKLLAYTILDALRGHHDRRRRGHRAGIRTRVPARLGAEADHFPDACGFPHRHRPGRPADLCPRPSDIAPHPAQ